MASYHCQICAMAMSIARIRTPDDPPDTAWNYKGCAYVGFGQFQDIYGDSFPDQHCEQCTTIDRTSATLDDDIKNAVLDNSLSPDEEDEDDEWLPEENSDMRSEKLEYDTEADSDVESSNTSQCDDQDSDDWKTDTNIQHALRKMHAPPLPKYLPHGTLHKGYMYTREQQTPQHLGDLLQKQACGSYRLPLEHIAAPSCQSLQGINGHVLSADQMKGCRNHRFLLAKPLDWQADDNDSIFESGSSFVLSGESNGSYISPVNPYVYPPRYGVDRVDCWTLYANEGCNDSDGWRPLPVHSYCLDIFAKLSYRRLGRVDLDGIWHWREMQSSPESYHLTKDDVSPCEEVTRGRQEHSVWCHKPGDEWLAANPVEVPESCSLVESCFSSVTIHCDTTQNSQTRLLGLSAELIDHIMSFLEEKDLNIVATTCRGLRHHTQIFFKALAVEHMSWLWEIFEAERYPSSPDWPVTWDPCSPPGLIVPGPPYNLPSEEQEAELWEEILKDDPDVESVRNAVKTFNALRREAILDSHRARVAQSLQEWRDFRGGVAEWVFRRPLSEAHVGLDWARLWRLFNPVTTSMPGIRNRARIWKDCERILDHNIRLHEQGAMDAKREVVREVISYNREQWWDGATTARHDPSSNGFLRRMWPDE